MILAFKKEFVEPILSGRKIHTIREDKANQWQPGKKIHAATGVRTKSYRPFMESVCVSTQFIQIYPQGISPKPWIAVEFTKNLTFQMSAEQVDLLARNDGFESTEDFWEWFKNPVRAKLIHWTEFRYEPPKPKVGQKDTIIFLH